MKCIDQRSDCFPERLGEMPDIDKAFVVRQVLALQNNFSGVDPRLWQMMSLSLIVMSVRPVSMFRNLPLLRPVRPEIFS